MSDEDDDKRPGPSTRRPRPAFLLVLCLVLGMGGGMIFDRWLSLALVPSGAFSSFRLMAEAWDTIQGYYVDRAAVQPKTLAYGAISGMVDALNDSGHSVFLSPGMARRLSADERGQLKGIGVEIQMKNKHVVIVAPIDNSPAQRAGLLAGDIIMSVDGRDIVGQPLNQVVEQISGPVGTSVKLAVLDPQTRRIRTVTIVRANIKINNVSWQRLPGTGVADLRIASFNEGVADELRQALREIQQQKLRGLILDLRNNPGGVLQEAVVCASQFLAGGNVLLVKDAKGTVKSVPVEPGGLDTNSPMAVLINGGSASAAEIVAGALRDAHRATLIGETTFGTGTVLDEFPLSDGSALMLAVQEWLTPDGQSYWHKGIPPELEVSLAPDVDPLTPDTERGLTAAELQSSDDKQLLRALKWVQAKMAPENARDAAVDSGTAVIPASHEE